MKNMFGALLSLLLAACATQAPVVAPVKKPLAPLVAEPTEVQLMATVDDQKSVFFLPGSAQIDAEGLRIVRRHAERLKAEPKRLLTLLGYTDDVGSPSYNLAIAEQRINAVSAQLRAQGVAARQIRRQVVGHEKLAGTCRSAACRQKMRRVELSYAN